MPSSSSNYYSIDDILAEEELVPCTTLFEFSHLSHLDPENNNVVVGADNTEKQHNSLPESSRIKMQLWAVEKWAMLGFVRLALPRHFTRKSRERLQAEPSDVDLRKRNERFFLSGRMLVDLIEQSSKKVAKAIASQGGRNARRNNGQILALENVLKESRELRKTLLSAYTGDRLRNTLDWSLSSVNDDVTSYTEKLSEMERRLFSRGALASSNHTKWKLNGGNRRLVLVSTTKSSNINNNKEANSGNGGGDGTSSNNNQSTTPDNNNNNKRQRIQ